MFKDKDQLDESKNSRQNKLILIGVISLAHGIKGEVIIKSFTSPPENIFNLKIEDRSGNDISINHVSKHKSGGFICTVSGCWARNQAEQLKKTALYCRRSNLPLLAEDEFYFEDLKGKIVKNDKDEEIGRIINVDNFGAGDIIEIKFNDNSRTEFFPFTDEFFPVIDKDYVLLVIPSGYYTL